MGNLTSKDPNELPFYKKWFPQNVLMREVEREQKLRVKCPVHDMIWVRRTSLMLYKEGDEVMIDCRKCGKRETHTITKVYYTKVIKITEYYD